VTLNAGSKLGPYEIVAPLGAGGMGEVYRARDPRLGRDVAIKALPAAFALDPERLARFEREAKLLASLSHANVGSIFGVEEMAGSRYLVLEFVEGETLAGRLGSGALPVGEALAVCEQIAAAVESAHEAGVIHRDLKPGNVMLKPDGVVKVLDFGLAKSNSGSSSSDPNLSASPTILHDATVAGVILGTAAYMSPEQARGRPVDRRTDIWSFGCVLYECLTGRRTFEGETVSDLVARILEREPDWSALPAGVPESVRRLLERCLTKDARERLRDIGEARITLHEARRSSRASSAPRVGVARPNRRSMLPVLIIALAGVVAGVVAGKLLLGGRSSAGAARVTRLAVNTPFADESFGNLGSYAISPDGGSLVFVAADSQGTDRLMVRSLDREGARVIDGTEGAQWPFWSPDSRDIAFFADGRLRRIPAAGGPMRSVCAASQGRGGSWSAGGDIVFAPDPRGGLMAVDAEGGVPRVVTTVDSTKNEVSHRFPSFLADGRHFVFMAQEAGSVLAARAMVGSLDGSKPWDLMMSGSAPVFAAPDQVVFTSDRALLTQRIDPRSFKMVGKPRLLADQPEVTGTIQLSPATSCARTGVMAYTPPELRPTTAVWVERNGSITATGVRFPGAVATGCLSPDGRRIAVMEAAPEGYANWVGDLENGTVVCVAPIPKGVYAPLWNPAGTRLVGATVAGLRQIDLASGAESVLVAGQRNWRIPGAWDRDGHTLLFSEMVPGNRYDIRSLAWIPSELPKSLIATPSDETDPSLSHDGRWVAYWSNASGRYEVQVESFPDRSERVRSTVGRNPGKFGGQFKIAWSVDDRALYFVGGDGFTLYTIEVRPTPRLALGVPRPVGTMPREARDVILSETGRALVLLPVGNRPGSITIVHGWMGEKRATP